ncbi:phospholipase D-like domain-containing protein [Halorarum salinum]|uniref:Phospholipase n=1 Tax=Halorarum salinum TaxID=2743089 RepID=A0A7D5LB50_9EURY|nr:phospholipase D-like domain-containing protein [Halobaculum salinum]QLG62666.1 phospholipase [Halobaculum salinum]
MRRRSLAVLLALLLAATAPPGAAATAVVSGETPHDGDPATGPRIVSVYPNPPTPGDRGEYVQVHVPPGNWTLSDGESSVTFGGDGGRVVVTGEPDALPNGTDGRVRESRLELSNAGERLVLVRGNVSGPAVDSVEYETAPEGERWLRSADPNWRPLGYEPREAKAVGAAEATAFVLPDAPELPVETIRGAERRLLLAGYTFGSERATSALVAAAERGVRVRVLVDDAPVGGITTRQAELFDRLVRSGVDVRVLGGEHARFRYHHPKYAVVDDAALVTTENWKPAGTGGADSRGWGVRLDSRPAADELASVFDHDAGWRDARPWREYSDGESFTPAEAEDGSYPAEFDPERVDARNVTVLTAPGNAEGGVVEVIDAADDRVDVVQPTVEDGPMLAATRRAAERGVEVRLLLSGAWYVNEGNAALAERLNDWADRTAVPLEVRLADPAGRYGKVHAKGVVADDAVVVGSLNWNPTSARENREVAVVLHGPEPAAYYRRVFEADWRAGTGGPPRGLLLAGVGAAAGTVLYARRRIEFA